LVQVTGMNKVAVYGGLGNQMFQYALCTALNENGQKARLSFSCYLFYKHHNGFELARAFKLKLPFQSKALNFFLQHAGFIYKNKIAAGFFRRAIGWHEARQNAYKEKSEFVFDAAVFSQQNVFFTGTWQSELYFKKIAAQIQKQFVFKAPTDDGNKKLVKEINNCNAISIHIRRGDYLQSHWKQSLGVIKDMEYYKAAAAVMESRVSNPRYFIFSDDMEWVKANLPLAGCIYVDHNKDSSSFADMYLMSLCKHNIIANSTFSWWAAWLNQNPGKIVIMPEKWMNNNACEGLYFNEWIKLKV